MYLLQYSIFIVGVLGPTQRAQDEPPLLAALTHFQEKP